MRFHDLRHTYGSLLVAGGVDLQSVKAAMGHSRNTTTERYLHARPATEQAARFTRAFAGVLEVPKRAGRRRVSEPGLPRTVRATDGRTVVFAESSWRHIQAARPELLREIEAILVAIARPDVQERDPRPGRERFYRRHISDRVRWLRVIVDFNEDPAVVRHRVHPAQGPEQAMSITINNITFDHHAYDERGDVLYLSVGEPRVPAETDPTPEGHAVDFDANGNVIAMILVKRQVAHRTRRRIANHMA